MKGLSPLPTAQELEKASLRLLSVLHGQNESQKEGVNLTEEDLVLYSQWVRFDPRLGEILIDFLYSHWSQFSALKIQTLFYHDSLGSSSRYPWPQVWGVLCEHVELLFKLRKTSKDDLDNFKLWASICCLRMVRSDVYESFFIFHTTFGGIRAQESAEKANDLYLRWGYLESHLLLNKSLFTMKHRTYLSSDRRKGIFDQYLKAALESGQKITVADYRASCEGLVSIRQAQLDFKQWLTAYRLKAVGRTKNKFYRS
jgi:hypothetical protein